MKRIAFITSLENAAITDDDQILAKYLGELSVACEGTAWDADTIDWTVFDLLLIRSCWNYHIAPDKFVAWINLLKMNFKVIINPPHLILWNMNKFYLRELAIKGVFIPDTVWLSERDFTKENLSTMMKAKNWKKAILKPCISASSFHTNLINENSLDGEVDNLALKFITGGMMLQEFMDEIIQTGELSLMFFDGAFSHAVIKTATPGEFRVQHQFGGKSAPIEVSKEIVRAGERILEALPTAPLYARVDGIMIRNTFTLMELELIEPVLFFRHAPPDSLKKMAARIYRIL